MGSVLMLGPVAGVAEGLGAARELAHVGLLPGVRAQVGLQVLQPRVGLSASLELNRECIIGNREIERNRVKQKKYEEE